MALNAPYRPGDRLAAVEYTALTLLRKVAPRMIVVDEVHNRDAGAGLTVEAMPACKHVNGSQECPVQRWLGLARHVWSGIGSKPRNVVSFAMSRAMMVSAQPRQ